VHGWVPPGRPTLALAGVGRATTTASVLGVSPRSGYYGPITAAKVRAFQQAKHLPVTGVVDTTTATVLRIR